MTDKIKIGLIFGGNSSEYEVSIMSAKTSSPTNGLSKTLNSPLMFIQCGLLTMDT